MVTQGERYHLVHRNRMQLDVNGLVLQQTVVRDLRQPLFVLFRRHVAYLGVEQVGRIQGMASNFLLSLRLPVLMENQAADRAAIHHHRAALKVSCGNLGNEELSPGTRHRVSRSCRMMSTPRGPSTKGSGYLAFNSAQTCSTVFQPRRMMGCPPAP